MNHKSVLFSPLILFTYSLPLFSPHIFPYSPLFSPLILFPIFLFPIILFPIILFPIVLFPIIPFSIILFPIILPYYSSLLFFPYSLPLFFPYSHPLFSPLIFSYSPLYLSPYSPFVFRTPSLFPAQKDIARRLPYLPPCQTVRAAFCETRLFSSLLLSPLILPLFFPYSLPLFFPYSLPLFSPLIFLILSLYLSLCFPTKRILYGDFRIFLHAKLFAEHFVEPGLFSPYSFLILFLYSLPLFSLILSLILSLFLSLYLSPYSPFVLLRFFRRKRILYGDFRTFLHAKLFAEHFVEPGLFSPLILSLFSPLILSLFSPLTLSLFSPLILSLYLSLYLSLCFPTKRILYGDFRTFLHAKLFAQHFVEPRKADCAWHAQ
jgi:hypothetical protein